MLLQMLKKYQIYQHQLRRCSPCEPQSSTRHNSIGLNVKAIKVMVALVWASTCVLNLFEALLFDALLVVWSAAVTLYRRSTWKAIDLLECKLSTPTNSSLAPGLRHWQEPRKSSRSQRPRVETSIYLYVYIIWYQLISYWFILTSHYSLMLDSILSCLPWFLPVSQCFSIAQSLLPLTPHGNAKPPIPSKAQEISRLQKKQSFKAKAGAKAGANVAENALKNEVQKVPGWYVMHWNRMK